MTKKDLITKYEREPEGLGYIDPWCYNKWWRWFTKFGHPVIIPYLKQKLRYLMLKYLGILLVLKEEE